MQTQIDIYKAEIEGQKKELDACRANLNKAMNRKMSIVFDTVPINQSLNSLEEGIKNWTAKLGELVQQKEEISSAESQHLAEMRKAVDGITLRFEQESKNFSSHLDQLANIVNSMEETHRAGVPEFFQGVSLSSNVAWASPSLLCLRLREEYDQVTREFADFKSKLSQESTSIVQAHQDQAEKIKELSSQLVDITNKYLKEKEEKDAMIATLKNTERAVYDAVKYQAALDETALLKEKIDQLKAELAREKGIRLNEFFDAQMRASRAIELTEEVNRLTNVQSQLNASIQKLKETHELQMRTKYYEIEALESEKKLLVDGSVEYLSPRNVWSLSSTCSNPT